MELHLTLFTALSWWLFTLNGSWVHSTQNLLSLSPNLCPRNDNLDFEGPKINNFTFIFHLQLLCLCSEWDLLVFCVRGKKSGKLGWVENAKWLPLTIIPPLSLPAITYTLVVDLLFTLRQANWHAISSLPWSPTRIPSQQQLKKKLWKGPPSSTKTQNLSHQPASHGTLLSIREVVFHVQGQG